MSGLSIKKGLNKNYAELCRTWLAIQHCVKIRFYKLAILNPLSDVVELKSLVVKNL